MLFIDRLAEERREGYAKAIVDLAKDELITKEVAAERLGISIEELKKLIKER